MSQDWIHLSPPHLVGEEEQYLRDALASNWIAPTGPQIDAFEREFAEVVRMPDAVALSSGTAALHLALKLARVRRGDEVLCSTLTFVASAAPILYEGATPVFIDSDEATWNMDPELLAEELYRRARRGKLPRAVIVVHLYGQSADLAPIRRACDDFGVTLIEDAAESLGAQYRGKATGTVGDFGIFSFNGNKIITTSGGGMLVARDPRQLERARHLAAQAKDPAPHYEHSQLGHNYRLSNLLAAVGRVQLQALTERVEARRRNFEAYRAALGGEPGIDWMPEANFGRSSRWLSVITIDPARFGATAQQVREHLVAARIETRPVWKPLHMQPLFRRCTHVGGGVARRLFEQGLCLPSGSALTQAQLERVSERLLSTPRRFESDTAQPVKAAVGAVR